MHHHSNNQTFEFQNTEPQPFGTALGDLNVWFHEVLDDFSSDVRAAVVDGRVPVVVRIDSRILLCIGEQPVEIFTVNDEQYHTLKALAHLPLLAYLLCATGQHSAASGAALQAALDENEAFLEGCGMTLEPLKTAITTLLTEDKRIDTEKNAIMTVTDLQGLCIKLAAKSEVTALLRITGEMQSDLSDEQWQKTHFVICGGNQPRYQQLSKSFFERLLREESGSKDQAIHRIIYSENCQTPDDARQLVVNRLVSGRLAKLFLNNPLSLDKDVLGEAGLKAIDTAFSHLDCLKP